MGLKSDVMGRTSGVLMWLRRQSIPVHQGADSIDIMLLYLHFQNALEGVYSL